jgi:glycosyltransferase involved in cell wall biosynthesis
VPELTQTLPGPSRKSQFFDRLEKRRVMRKLVLLGPYPPPYGGVAIYMRNLYALLTRDQEQISVLALDYQGSEPHIYNLRTNPYSLWQHIHRFGPDVLYLDSSTFCMEYPFMRLAFPWLALKKYMRLKWIKVIHDGTLPARYTGFSRLHRLLFELSLASIDHVIVVSQNLADWLETEFRYKRAITVVSSLLPPIDFTIDNPTLERTIHDFRQRHKRLVCSIGVFDPLYGFDQIVHTVNVLRKVQNYDLGLILIDGGFVTNQAYRQRVLDTHKWILPLATLTHSETMYTLRQCDVFIRGVERESYGLSRVEAIWSGIPVVATNVGETRGMLLYEYGDVKGLETQLYTALSHSSQASIDQWAQVFRNEAQRNIARTQALLAAI